MYFLIVFFFILICFYIENKINRACLDSFRAVIHVNGTRGKTSTCRYLDAVLRPDYRVFTKTTGTDAMMINADGRQIPCRRLGLPGIREQIRTIRRARKENAEILILECMAVRPEFQKACQNLIVKSKTTVITNVHRDHILDMGNTVSEIAAAMASTIPENGVLYTADPDALSLFGEICREKNCRLVSCPAEGTAADNIALARLVAEDLGISREQFDQRLSSVKEDFGTEKLYRVKNKKGEAFSFLNLFSANDPASASRSLSDYRCAGSDICFIYNHRADRPDRALLFAEDFFPDYPESTVYICGSNASLPLRLFRKAGVKDIRKLSESEVLSMDVFDAGKLIVGIGNIKGTGYSLTEILDKQDRQYG